MGKRNDTQKLLRLMKEAKAGSSLAFEKIYNELFTPVYQFIFFKVKNKEQAEDFAQTVFLKVFQKIDKFKDQNVSPLSYFIMVARNMVIDHWRKKKEVLATEPEILFNNQKDIRDGPEQNIEQKEHKKFVQENLKILNDNQREVITMRFINELSNKEISSVLDKKEATIRKMQSRALIKLRTRLNRP